MPSRAPQQALGRPELEKYAAELGLDLGRFGQALDTRKHKARVERDLAMGNQAALGGTPGFVVNVHRARRGWAGLDGRCSS